MRMNVIIHHKIVFLQKSLPFNFNDSFKNRFKSVRIFSRPIRYNSLILALNGNANTNTALVFGGDGGAVPHVVGVVDTFKPAISLSACVPKANFFGGILSHIYRSLSNRTFSFPKIYNWFILALDGRVTLMVVFLSLSFDEVVLVVVVEVALVMMENLV